MRKKLAIILVTSGSLMLAGCGTVPEAQPFEKTDTYSGFTIEEIKHKLKDGREVVCLVEDGGHDGGISCDWDNATTEAR